MSLANQVDRLLWPVDKSGEKVGNISTQYTHIQRSHFCHCGILPPKQDFAVIFAAEPQPGFDKDCAYDSSDAADPFFSYKARKAQRS